jgi:hypothetical protein
VVLVQQGEGFVLLARDQMGLQSFDGWRTPRVYK